MLNYTCLHFSDLVIEELFDILALRQKIFIVEQKCIYQDADSFDKNSWHVLGQDSYDSLLAYSRIIPNEYYAEKYINISRVLIASSIRNSGEGKILMNNTIEFTHNLFGKIPIKISAQTYLIKYYQNLGFEINGGTFLEDGIPHIAMILND